MGYVFCIGEALIDFTSAGQIPGGGSLFEQNAGGAPANVACALTRLGTRAFMCGKVGADMFGEHLRNVLRAEGVNTDNLLVDGGAPTTLAFVALDSSGERSFAFIRSPGADTRLRFEEMDLAQLRQGAVLHFGTLSLTHEPSRSALMQAVEFARNHGIITSIDVNLRLPLWERTESAHHQLHRILPWCDMVKLSYEELYFAFHPASQTGILDKALVPKLARELLQKYHHIKLLCVTLGSQGSLAFFRNMGGTLSQVESKAFKVKATDTTGAGDAFTAAMLHQLLGYTEINDFLSQEALAVALEFANACAAICVTKRGAIAAMPYYHEAQAFVYGNQGEPKNNQTM